MTQSRGGSGKAKTQNGTIHGSNIERLLTVNEVAHKLSVGRTLVYKLMDQNRLAYITIGRTRRVRIEDVNDLIAKNRVGGPHVA